MQVSLPPFFINKQHNFDIRDEIRDEILRDIEADITDGAHNEEDPDAEIDELDFFSDED